MVTGGVPAQYGDATGGIISITTRGPSRKFSGGLEIYSSALTDPYNNNLVGLNVSGPIYSKKSDDGTKRPIVGFFVAGEFQADKDPSPSAIGFYKVKDDVLDDLRKNPIAANPNGNGFIRRAEDVRLSDLEPIKAFQNVKNRAVRLNGKIDIQPAKNFTITVGGSGEYQRFNEFTYSYALFNPYNNPQITRTAYRGFVRLLHRLGGNAETKESSSSVIKNAFYVLQADYSKSKEVREDESHRDNLFEYGYLGQFKSYRRLGTGTVDSYVFDPNGTPDDQYDTVSVNGTTSFIDDSITFAAGDINPDIQAYTQQYYDLFGNPRNFVQLINDGALINGTRADPVYALAWNTGREPNSYRIDDNTSLRLTATGSADIKNHNIQLGFEYEQRTDAFYATAPIGLWNRMRGLQNLKNRVNRFQNDPGASYDVGTDTWTFPVRYVDDGKVGFYENIREALGLSNDAYIDIDSYGPETFKIDYFNAEELLQAGLVDYAGYSYTGKKLTSRPSFNDYFNKVDEDGNFTRENAPFAPIYMAGYIQDKFAVNDLIFNIGVRVDRFDANQKVLKDKFVLYETKTAGQLNIANRPSNIGDDYVVYVADVKNPSENNVVGYRNGEDWYDAEGNLLSDPRVLSNATTTGTVAPYLVNPSDDIRSGSFNTSSSFKDYDPQITFMPRIAFSFPISDMALFFAHYDILTQRPPDRWRVTPRDYFDLLGGTINNPNLKPEKTIDYELGFKQALSRSSSLSISAFYREFKDMIQLRNIAFAYPNNYVTYDNFDFGTAKGLVLTYDLRRTGNVRMNVSYTLQFADGTGSGDRSGLELINLGQPNLRSIAPLDFDQRHTLVTVFDYHYGSGTDYNGPIWFGKQFFANAGFNFIFNAGSGTPYSQLRNIRTEVDNIGLQQAGSSQLRGSINGSRLPWQNRVDLRVDKQFMFDKGEKKGAFGLMVYAQILNLFNTDNIVNVYRFTGNPEDDGFLNSAIGQQLVATKPNPDAYTEMYRVMANNPANYSLPRRIRLGVEFTF
ncbi:MAG: hypothetical protein IPO27_14925 [Bacteroidetes bacterium]|nr:hypothetical protein [Bacteroidota bacterium]